MKKVRSFFENKFIKNVVTIMTGTALAQIITFTLMPVITRLYGPEPIGVLGTFSAIVAILGPVAALTYPTAIVLPQRDQDARLIVRMALVFSGLTATVLLIISILYSAPIARFFNLEPISSFLYLLSLYMFFSTISQVMAQWLIRKRQYKIQAKSSILQSVFTNISKIATGFFYPLSLSLVIIQTVAVLFNPIMMFYMSDKSVRRKDERSAFSEIKEVAFQHRDFPLYRAPQVTINAFSQGLPILLLSGFFGPVVAGFYALGRQALNTPVQLIGKAVQDVFYPRVNELLNDRKDITPFLFNAIVILFFVGIVPFGAIIFFGPKIFSVVFGTEWLTAGEYARWIALVSLSLLMTRPVIATIPVMKIQGHFLVVEIVGTVAKAGFLLLGIYYYGEAIYAVALFSIASVAMYAYLTLHTLAACKKYDYSNSIDKKGTH